MGFQLAIPGTEPAIVDGDVAAMIGAAMRAAARTKRPYAENTHRAYDRIGKRYKHWCARLQLEPFPLSPKKLTAFLEYLTEQTTRFGQTTAPSSVRQAMSALCTTDRFYRATDDDPDPRSVAETPWVEAWLMNWERSHAKAPRSRAPVIGRPQLLAIVEAFATKTNGAAHLPWAARAARDRAIWLIGIAAALRVDDLAQLHTRGVQVVDRGLTIHVERSKTDQAGEGKLRAVMRAGTLALCPVHAWTEWLRFRGDWGGPAFVSIERTGHLGESMLTTRTLQRILQDNAGRVGVHVSGHTLRRTFATTARRRGMRDDRIQAQGGWARADSMRPYIEYESVWEDNPTAGLFDG